MSTPDENQSKLEFYQAVLAQDEDTVRRMVADFGQNSAKARDGLLNGKVWIAALQGRESPLQLAHSRGLGRMVGVLMECGADSSSICGGQLSRLQVCVLHGQPESVERLLAKKKEKKKKSNNKYRKKMKEDIDNAVHVAFKGCQYAWGDEEEENTFTDDGEPPPVPYTKGGVEVVSPGQLDCVGVLGREGGANINALDAAGNTPLFYVKNWLPDLELFHLAFELLLGEEGLGADVDARNGEKARTAIFDYARPSMPMGLGPLLFDYGASADVVDREGWTPLMVACQAVASGDFGSAQHDGELTVLELLKASSRETRRATCNKTGKSAVDLLAEMPPDRPVWIDKVIAELMVSGVPVKPENAARVLPFLTSTGRLARADRQARELAARRDPSRRWRAHDDVVQLVFDFKEWSEAEAAVARREARVRELEEQLRELGYGTHSSSSDDDDDDDGDDEEAEEEQEAGGEAQATDNSEGERREEAGASGDDDDDDDGAAPSGEEPSPVADAATAAATTTP